MADALADIFSQLEKGKEPTDADLERLDKEIADLAPAGGVDAMRRQLADRPIIPVDVDKIEATADTAALSPFVHPYKDAAELFHAVQKLGINVPEAGGEYPFKEDEERDAGRILAQIFQDNGWTDVQAPGIEEKKRQLALGVQAFVRVRNAPWDGPDRDLYAARTLDRIIDQAVTRGYEQIRGLPPADQQKVVPVQEELAAAAAILREQPTETKAELVRMSTARARDPRNASEVADYIRYGQNWTIGEAITDASVQWSRLWFGASPINMLGGGKYDDLELLALTKRILGNSAEEQIARAFEQTKVNVHAHRLGLLRSQTGLVSAGTSADGGATVFDFTGPGVVAELSALAAAGKDNETASAIMQADPAAWNSWGEARAQGNEFDAARIKEATVGRALTLAAYGAAKEQGASVPDPLIAFGLTGSHPITPVEESAVGPLRGIQVGLNELGMGIANLFSATARDLDETVSSIPAVRNAVRPLAEHLGADPELAKTARTISDSLKVVFRTWMDRQGVVRPVPEGEGTLVFGPGGTVAAPGVVLDSIEGTSAQLAGIEALGPEARRAVLEVLNDPFKALAETPSADRDRQRRLINDTLDGLAPRSDDSLAAAIVQVGFHDLWQGFKNMFAMVVDSPREAVAIALGGTTGTVVAKNTWGRWRTAHERVLAAGRLQNQLRIVADYHPQAARLFLDGTKRALKDALDTNAPEAVTNRLQSAAAVLEQVRQEVGTTGQIANLDEFSRTLVSNWSNIKGHLGDLGAALGTKAVHPSLLDRLRLTWTELVGSRANPDKQLTALIAQFGGNDIGLEGVRALLGSSASGQKFRNNLVAYFEANGKWPSERVTLLEMAPQEVLDLNGLILAGKRSADVQLPPVQRVLRRIFPKLRLPDKLAQLGDAAHDIVSAGIHASFEDEALKMAWEAGPRPRGELLARVAMDKIGQRRDMLRLQELGLRDLMGQPRTDMALLEAELRHVADQTARLDEQAGVLQVAVDRLLQHEPRKPWRFSPQAEEILKREIDAETLSLTMDAFPALWPQGSQALWNTRRIPSSTRAIQTLQGDVRKIEAHVAQVQKRIERAKNNPTNYDVGYQAAVRAEKQLSAKIKAVKAGGLLPDPVDLAQLDATRKAVKARRHALQVDKATPSDVLLGEADIIGSRAEHAAAVRRLDEARAGREVRELRPSAMEDVDRQLRHGGASAFLNGTVERLEGKIADLHAAQRFRYTDNLWSFYSLPPWLRGHTLNLLHRNADAIMAEHGARAAHILRRERKLGRAEYDALAAAQMGRPLQGPPTFGYDPAPDTPLGQLLQDDFQLLAEVHEELRKQGKMPQKMLDRLKNVGYDPSIYGLFERYKLVTEKEALAEIETAGGKRPSAADIGFGRTIQADHLLFRRHATDWRVWINEPSTLIDQTFKTQDAALGYLRSRYGDNAVQSWTNDPEQGPSLRRGKTPFGDPVVLGAPMKDAVNILGPVEGRTPEKRAIVAHRLMRSLTQGNVAEFLSHIPGLVMDDLEYTKLKASASTRPLARQFEKLPDNPDYYGKLANKHVHKSVLTGMRRAGMTYDKLRNMVSGLEESLIAHQDTLAGAAALRLTRAALKGIDIGNRIVRQTQVALSEAAWVTNIMGHFFSDFMSGSPVFSSSSIDTWHWLLSGRYRTDPITGMARRLGIGEGFFPEQLGDFRESLIDMLGMNTKDVAALKKLHKERDALRQAAYQARIDGDKRRIADLEKDVPAIEAAIREAELPWFKRLGRWMGDWFVGGMKDKLGRPVNWANEKLVKRGYSFIDEAMKLMKFRNLMTKEGLPPQAAAHRVRMFYQMYNEVPWWIRNTPSPLAATIMSFPYEYLRITKNAIVHAPEKVIAWFGAVPMLNVATLSAAGINYDRFREILEARGARDGVSALAMFSSQIFIPRGRNIAFTVDASGLLALGSLMRNKGMVGQIYNDFFPPEERGFVGHVAGAAAGFASNYLFNNVAMNFLGQVATNRDPLTGRQILEKDAGTIARLKSYGKTLAASLLPFGRFAVNYGKADDDVVNPVTGRPFQRPYESETIGRALTGIGLKGDLSGKEPLVDDVDLTISILYRMAHTFDPNRRLGDYPTESVRNEKRSLLYEAESQAKSLEERSRARADFEAMARETAEADLGYMKVGTGRTTREILMEIKAIQEAGPESFFAGLPIDAQAASLVQMDRARVNSQLIKAMIDAATMAPGLELRFLTEKDPERVHRAIQILEGGVKAEGHSPALDEWLAHLRLFVVPMTDVNRLMEVQLGPTMDLLRQQAKEARRAK